MPGKALKMQPQTEAMWRRVLAKLKPPPKLTLSQWADNYRMLNAKSSAMPGRWHTDNAPWMREVMDTMSDPHEHKTVMMCSAQVSKTDSLLNAVGYNAHYHPAPIIIMEPTIEMGEALSKDRLTPMFNDTPELKRLLTNRKYGGADTILKKDFQGGSVTIIGANSPNALRSRPAKILLADEVDAYPASAGKEGDPLMLLEKRTTTFWDRKIFMVSTPTDKSTSRIYEEYMGGTQEDWNLPCPECGEYQPLVWANVDFKTEPGRVLYRCEKCGCLNGEQRWKAQSLRGKYVAANPGAPYRSFHMNTLGSLFCGWDGVVEKFLHAWENARSGDIEQLKVWTNTELGEPWEERGETVEAEELLQRCEVYDAEVPDGVICLTAGVDTQDDRFEVEVVGWGEGHESWGIRYQKIYGDLTQPTVWEDLDRFLMQPWYTKDGGILYIMAACVDSGGHFADQVLRFCNERVERRIFAIKGKGGADVKYLNNLSKNNRVKAPLFTLGVDSGKARIYHSLRAAAKGPNYCHFPMNDGAGYYCDEYFRGLASEKMVLHKKQGRPVQTWEIKDHKHKRNEPLDCRNYALAALTIANPPLKREALDKAANQHTGRRMRSGGI